MPCGGGGVCEGGGRSTNGGGVCEGGGGRSTNGGGVCEGGGGTQHQCQQQDVSVGCTDNWRSARAPNSKA